MREARENGASRRGILRLGIGAAAAAIGAGDMSADREPADDGDALDRALERLHATVTSDTHFLSNHVPMAVEALDTLGRADAIASWGDAHLEPTDSDPPDRVPVLEEDWRVALGRPERFLDWRASFRRWLEDDDWRAVLKRWGARLVPGLAGVATHGVIRTAHATRALGRRDVPIRRLELATALAYWAAFYEELPWNGEIAPEHSVAGALARVTPRLPEREPPRGNIVAGLRALGDMPSFAPVAGLVDARDPEEALSQITAAFAGVFLRNPGRRVHFTHAITAPSALRLVAPYLDEETVVRGTRFAWQAAAGLYVVYHDPRNEAPAPAAPLTRDALVARAVDNGDAHAIKLTEACLREEAIAPDARRLAAAADGAAGL